MQKNDFVLFLDVKSKCPDWNETRTSVWHYLLNIYTMFQNNIPKHVEELPGKLGKIRNAQNNRKNSENTIFANNGTYVEKYTAGHLRTKFEEFTLIYKATFAKIGFDMLLAVN